MLIFWGFPGGSDSKASACSVGDPGSIPGLGKSPGEGNGNPLQNSCLENSMDGEAWWAPVHGVAKSRMQLQFHFTFTLFVCSTSHVGLHFPDQGSTWVQTVKELSPKHWKPGNSLKIFF